MAFATDEQFPVGEFDPNGAVSAYPADSTMAITMDDVQGPGMDALGSAPDVQTIEDALVQYLQDGQQRSIGMFQTRKRAWAQYKLMKEERGSYDDPTDPLVRLGLHLPVLGKLVDVMRAGMVSEVLPDPSEMNFFEFKDERGYFEEYATRMQYLTRKKYQTMKAAAGDFQTVADMLCDDYLTLGNEVSIKTHEAIEGDADGDGLIQGPVTQYIDPMNWWPWDWDVNSADETQHNIFSPIDVYALKAGGYVNTEAVLAQETPTQDTRRDPDAEYYLLDMYWDGQQYSRTDLYHRYIHFGRFPGEDLRKASGIGDDVDDATLIGVLAQKFGFDPAKGLKSRWWHMEFIGKALIACQPYPLDLPMGCGPINHKDMIHKNGRLLGLGMYDRAAWDERLFNFYRRAEVHITKNAMNPPWWYLKGMIDPAWLQQQGTQYPQLVPGRPIPITGSLQGTQKPMEPFPYNIDAVPVAREQTEVHANSMRELTGATSAVEGQSNDPTATQSANNLQQSLKLINYLSDRFEGMLKRDVAASYCIIAQVLRMEGEGHVEYVVADLDEQGLALLDIRPEHALSLQYIKIVMTGRSAPGNRMNQAQAMAQWAQVWLPTGVVDSMEASKTHAEMLGISGARRLLLKPDQWQIVRGMQMRQMAFGPQGAMEMTGDKDRMALGQMQMGGPQGQQGGMPQVPMPGQTQQRGAGGAPMMAGAGTPQ